MQARHIPNLITALRLMLVAPLVWMLVEDRYEVALLLFVAMGASDGMDGFLAKRYGWQSRVGKFMDPLADKAMLVSTYLALGWLGGVPAWLVALIILRDLIIICGAVAYHFVTRRLEMNPTLLSKINTGAQILLAILVILDQFRPIGDVAMNALIAVVLLTTMASGAHYVFEWSRRTRAIGQS
jgi:cardiolipin synthase